MNRLKAWRPAERPGVCPAPRRVSALAILLALMAGCAPRATERPQPTDKAPRVHTVPPRTDTPSSKASTPKPARPTYVPTASPTADCLDLNGTVEQATYHGVALAEEVPYLIYLPPCYNEGDQDLATLYLLHGYPFDETHWIDLGAIEAAERMILRRERMPFLVVLPRQPAPLFRNTDGGPGSYEQEFVEGLLLAIEGRYRAQADPEGRALGGLSRGGVWALEIGLRHPTLWSAVGAMSPALEVNYPRDAYDPFQLASEQDKLPARIALLAGEEDWAARGTARFREILIARGVEHLWLEVPGGHETGTWMSGIERFLGYLTEAWDSQREASR